MNTELQGSNFFWTAGVAPGALPRHPGKVRLSKRAIAKALVSLLPLVAEDLFTDLPDSQGRHVDARHVRSYFWSQLARAVALVTTVQELADPGDRVADVGTGYGFYAIILQELYHLEIYATDLETNLAPYGGLRRLFHVPEFAFDVTAPGLPIPAGNMDGVILSEVVEHLRVHPALPICNCARLVRDEGWILLTTPNVCRLPNILRILAGRNVSEPFPLEDVIGTDALRLT